MYPPGNLRKAESGDLQVVSRLDEEIFGKGEGWSLENFQNELKKAYSFLFVWENDRIEGYCVFSLAGDELELMNIGVIPECRRRGIAALMFKKALEALEFLSYQKLQLEVRSRSQPAILFYQRLGFNITGIRKNYYRSGEDALLMSVERSRLCI